MTSQHRHAPGELLDLISRCGLTADASEDDVQDALVGLLSGLEAQRNHRTIEDEDLLVWSRYSVHVGSQNRRLWWSVTSAARRAAAEIDTHRGPMGGPMTAQDDPHHPQRLGLDADVLHAIIDAVREPMSFDDVADEFHTGMRQDPVWLERDGRDVDEALPHPVDLVHDIGFERFIESVNEFQDANSLLRVLPDSYRYLLEVRFGFHDEPLTLEQTREYFDLGRGTFERRFRRAIGALQHPSRAIHREDYETVDATRRFPGPLDGDTRLAPLPEEPVGAAEAIVEALWAAGGDLPVEWLHAMIGLGPDAATLIDTASRDDRLSVDASGRLSLRTDAASLAPTGWRWRRPSGERARQVEAAERTLRANRKPMPYADLELAVAAETTTWNLRNALTSSPKFNRADRDVFALSHWKHEPYDSIEGLMQRFLERNGGEASLKDIIADLTSRFTIKEASIRAYAATDAFVPTSPGRIRNRGDDEEVEETAQEVSSIPNCFVKDGRWALRIRVDTKMLRGHSAQVPAGFAHHLKVKRRTSVRLPTDIGHEISVVRKGMSDTIGRLRRVAETLGLADGDTLILHAPRLRRDPVSFSAIRRGELVRGDAVRRVALLLGVDDATDRRAVAESLGMPVRSTAFALAGALRARGESSLASDVLATLGEHDRSGPATADIAGLLGL